MDATHRLPLNSRVRLRDGIDPALYNGFTCTGNEGWIRNQRDDEAGYSHVLIEWDHDHWAYNGAPNCWTWEDHFDLVEEPKMPEMPQDPQETSTPEEALRRLTEQFVSGLSAILKPETEEQPALIEDVPDPQRGQDITDEAVEALKNGKAFVVVSIQESENGVIHPAIYQQAETEHWALICQGQLGHATALLQDSLIHDRLQKAADAE